MKPLEHAKASSAASHSDLPSLPNFKMIRFPRVLLLLSVTASLLVNASKAAEEIPSWTDIRGNAFKATPIEGFGPLAVFKTKKRDHPVLMPFRLLGDAETRRFHSMISVAPLASRWSESSASLSQVLFSSLEKSSARLVEQKKIPEPEVYIIVSGLSSSQKTSVFGAKLANLQPFTGRMERVFPRRVATIILLPRGSKSKPKGKTPPGWYYVNRDKSKFWRDIDVSIRSGQVTFSTVTREGIPLVRHGIGGYNDVREFNDATSSILWKTHADNPRTFADRKFYATLTRPLEFTHGETTPLVLNSPFSEDTLRSLGITRIDARLKVNAKGQVIQTELLPSSQIPPDIAPSIEAALGKTPVVVPAIKRGKPTGGQVDFKVKVPVTNPQRQADRAWLTFNSPIDLPLKNWLVLKPIKVDASSAGSGYTVLDDGTVVMNSFVLNSNASKQQKMNSFNSNWFDDGGASQVKPEKGDKHIIDGETLHWKPAQALGGFYDFRNAKENMDDCIGYAWTEIDSDQEKDAWLGFASDDGVKVWFNGELVIDEFHIRSSRVDEDVVALKLRPGKNHLLLKIQNNKGHWSFFARLRVRE